MKMDHKNPLTIELDPLRPKYNS